MPYEFYKVLHLVGIFMIMLGYGGLVVTRLRGLDKESPGRALSNMTHGIGMLLMLVAGFGLLAKAQINWPWPGWVWGKLAIWLLLGGLIAIVRRKQQAAKPMWWVVLALSAVAAYFAIYKPF